MPSIAWYEKSSCDRCSDARLVKLVEPYLLLGEESCHTERRDLLQRRGVPKGRVEQQAEEEQGVEHCNRYATYSHVIVIITKSRLTFTIYL